MNRQASKDRRPRGLHFTCWSAACCRLMATMWWINQLPEPSFNLTPQVFNGRQIQLVVCLAHHWSVGNLLTTASPAAELAKSRTTPWDFFYASVAKWRDTELCGFLCPIVNEMQFVIKTDQTSMTCTFGAVRLKIELWHVILFRKYYIHRHFYAVMSTFKASLW